MERIIKQAFLYDFYGELLTSRQRKIYEEFVLNNLSLSEIAEEYGISRQGVHDLVRRCDKLLMGYEEKLNLMEKFFDTRQRVEKIRELLKHKEEYEQSELFEKIEQLSKEILENL